MNELQWPIPKHMLNSCLSPPVLRPSTKEDLVSRHLLHSFWWVPFSCPVKSDILLSINMAGHRHNSGITVIPRIRIRRILMFLASRIRTISQRYGSGSFYHAKTVRKTLIPTALWLFLTFYLWKIMYMYLQKIISTKTFPHQNVMTPQHCR
jgi:hypothetical protein